MLEAVSVNKFIIDSYNQLKNVIFQRKPNI